MSITGLTERFFKSTRGKLVTLLRGGARPVDELAGELALTNNAVRAHLVELQRDGLVRSAGARRGTGAGKPAALYELTPTAEVALSRAYAPILGAVLGSIGARLTRPQLVRLLREAGLRLAASLPKPVGSLRARAGWASQLLNSLGGLTTVEAGGRGTVVIRGIGCPLSAVVPDCPPLCHTVESLIGETTGARVRERCVRDGPRPHCQFELS